MQKNKHNIGFFARLASFGGGERVKNMLMEEYQRRGHQIFIFVYNKSISEQIDVPHKAVVLPRKSNAIFQLFSDIRNIYKAIKREQIDTMVIFGFMCRYAIASKLAKIPSLLSLRVDPKFAKNKILTSIRSKICLSLCNRIVFQTYKIRDRYSKSVKDKSIVIYNPIIDNLPEPVEKREKKIVAIGRLSGEKNYPLLINSFAKTDNNEYTLHIYGDGTLRGELETLIKKLHLEDKVFLMGKVNRVVEHIKKAEIFVLSSDYEGMPNALIEAMAMGLSCISTKFPSGAAEELITDRENGLLVNTNDTEAMCYAINTAMKNAELRNKTMKNALDIRNKLEKNKIIQEWIKEIDIIHCENNK